MSLLITVIIAVILITTVRSSRSGRPPLRPPAYRQPQHWSETTTGRRSIGDSSSRTRRTSTGKSNAGSKRIGMSSSATGMKMTPGSFVKSL